MPSWKLNTVFFLLIYVIGLSAETPSKRVIRSRAKAQSQPVLRDEANLDGVSDADLEAAWEREKKTTWTSPSIGVSVPSGFGADWGSIFGGINFVSQTISVNQSPIADGVVFVGAGFGNSSENLGLEVSYSVTDLDPFLADSVLAFKLHRYLGKGFGIGLGVENAFIFGEGIDGVANTYGALSKAFTFAPYNKWFSSVLVSGGVGTGRFCSFEKVLAKERNCAGAFGSVGVRVQAPLGLAFAWSGYGLDMGVSVTPFRSFRTSINLGFRNLVTNYAPGLTRAFDLTVTYSDSFFEDTFPFFSARPNR